MFFLIFFIFTLFIVAKNVFADGGESTLAGLKTAAETGYDVSGIDDDESGIVTNIPKAIGKIVGIFLQFVGTIFFLLMIYGGFTWMLARGNEQSVQKAKDIIEASIVGMVIVFAAYAFVAFIGTQLVE